MAAPQSTIDDARSIPQGAVAVRIPRRAHTQDKFHILPGQRADVAVGAVVKPFVALVKGPERIDRPGTDLVIETEIDVAGCGVVIAVDNRLEMVRRSERGRPDTAPGRSRCTRSVGAINRPGAPAVEPSSSLGLSTFRPAPFASSTAPGKGSVPAPLVHVAEAAFWTKS